MKDCPPAPTNLMTQHELISFHSHKHQQIFPTWFLKVDVMPENKKIRIEREELFKQVWEQ